MIAIQNFKAATTIETQGGTFLPVNCTVVGVVRDEDGHYDFIVVCEEDDQRWVAERDHVTAPDGRSFWPD